MLLVIQIFLFGFMLLHGCGNSSKNIRNVSDGGRLLPASSNYHLWVRASPASVSVEPMKAEVRLLNGVEFSNSVRSLLGIAPASSFAQADTTTGYSNGAGLQMDESLFTALNLEAQRLAVTYVKDHLLAAFPCFQTETPACLDEFITQFAGKAFRREVSASEQLALSAFYSTSLASLSNPMAAREQLVTRILLSPQFLYRKEVGHSIDKPNLTFLSDPEIADVISYTLTGDMPDQELKSALESGSFGPDLARQQIRRILASEKSQEWLVGFFKQWLMLGELDTMASEPGKYAKFSQATLGSSLRQEFHHFVRNVVFTNQGNLANLFLEPKMPINSDTAALYGRPSSSAQMQVADLDGTQRKGILMLASFFAVHSSSSELYKDSPIGRGTVIYDSVLCSEPLSASGVDTVTATSNAISNHSNFEELTVREQHEAMMEQDPSCQSCHVRFMPYGFLFGNFDALGAFQTQQKGKAIQTGVSNTLMDGQTKNYANALELTTDLAKSTTSAKCFATQFSRFLTGKVQNEGLASLFFAETISKNAAIAKLFEDALTSPELYLRKVSQ